MNQRIEVIAEIGQNFNGDMILAKEMIHAVKEAGADVAKFQLYDAVALFPKEGNPWYEYNCSTEISKDNLSDLVACCDKHDIEFMSSVFDVERVDWLEAVNMKRYKVASRSIYESSLIEKVKATGKPILASLGMYKEDGFPDIKYDNIGYFYCISKYPTQLEDVDFSNIDFDKYIGFSDHTIGISAPITAMCLGAKIIEKHFTLDKKMYGPDHECSMTPYELKGICDFRDDLIKIKH